MGLLMSDVFSYIWGQERVRDFFREAANKCALSQSYLFYGPAGSGKTQAAHVVAAAALCENNAPQALDVARGEGGTGERCVNSSTPQNPIGCNECETCKRVMRRHHPDVHFYEPAGAHAYLVEQIREIIADVQLAPIAAKGSVYIINRADLLSSASANAFLKTLEEPPAHATIILIARTKDSVLPTLVSRCVSVPFATLPARVSVGLVEQNAHVGEDRAAQALAACAGSVEAAITFAKKNENFEHMNRVFDCMAALRGADAWDIIKMSKELVQSSNGALDGIKAAQEEYAEFNKDYLNATLRKKLKDSNKREQTRAACAAQVQNLDIMRSWLRDVMMLCIYEESFGGAAANGTGGALGTCVAAGAENAAVASANTAHAPQIINKNVEVELREAARHTNASRVARALAAIDAAATKMNYNVSAQACTDALLIEQKVVLYDANSTS